MSSHASVRAVINSVHRVFLHRLIGWVMRQMGGGEVLATCSVTQSPRCRLKCPPILLNGRWQGARDHNSNWSLQDLTTERHLVLLFPLKPPHHKPQITPFREAINQNLLVKCFRGRRKAGAWQVRKSESASKRKRVNVPAVENNQAGNSQNYKWHVSVSGIIVFDSQLWGATRHGSEVARASHRGSLLHSAASQIRGSSSWVEVGGNDFHRRIQI